MLLKVFSNDWHQSVNCRPLAHNDISIFSVSQKIEKNQLVFYHREFEDCSRLYTSDLFNHLFFKFKKKNTLNIHDMSVILPETSDRLVNKVSHDPLPSIKLSLIEGIDINHMFLLRYKVVILERRHAG